MANEVLVRTPTSVGNRRVWTWSAWIKHNSISESGLPGIFAVHSSTGNQVNIGIGTTGGGYYSLTSTNSSEASNLFIAEEKQHKDYSSWINIVVSVDTTKEDAQNAVGIYINGVKDNIRTDTFPGNSQNIPKNHQSMMNFIAYHIIGQGIYFPFYTQMQMFDLFIVDGQALTPDVFGFYKSGKGYISSGSSVATDFRPGQWVPKSPRIIKAEINRRGGFGVNGVYIPMNDSNNFGADFHGTPNSIIKLQENLPQPKCRIDGVGDYTGALRDDPFKQYLVLAIPFVSGGLQSGLGDYSAAIRGSGIPKTVTSSNVSISTVPSYYGSASNFTSSSSSYITTPRNVSDYNMGSGDYTVEGWFYFKSINTGQYTRFFSIGNGSLEGIIFELVISTSVLSFYSRDTGSNDNRIDGPVIVAGQWYHIALCRKSSTISAYINGVCVGTANISTRTINFDSNTAVVIGAWENSVGSYTRFADAYMQDIRVYKGIAKYTGGFDVPRPYTPVGIATWRAVPDTTTNNFATLNPLITRVASGTAYPLTFTDGNLTATANATADSGNSCGIAVTSGKWYSEYRINTNNTSGSYKFSISVNPADKHWGIGNGGDQTGSIHFRPANAQLSSVSGVTFSTIYTLNYTIAIGDIIGVSLDMDNRQVSFYKNGTLITQSGGASAFPYSFSGTNSTSPYGFGLDIQGTGANQLTLNFGQNPTFSGNTTAGTFTDSNGKGLFKYQPPAGFLALCEDNLPKPTVEDPGKHFKTVLWTGNGSSRSISGVGFQPDLVWIKSRTNGAYFHNLVDSVRGPSRRLASNIPNAEDDASGGGATPILGSFDYDGFSLPNGNVNVNENNGSYIAWCWKAGNTTQTNTSGSITSTVSVNQTAGFSIVSWTGNGSAATVGHGLGKTPDFMVIKARNDGTYFWNSWHKGLSLSTNFIQWNTTNGQQTISVADIWNNGTRNSSVFGVGPHPATGGSFNYIAYCWAEIEGFSKFGSYVGNGSANGPFVYLGFKPAWVMIKPDGANGWVIIDNARKSINPNGETIFANVSDAEYTDISNREVNFLSNGFKIRATGSERNSSGVNYFFAAFAESPFQTANAK